ncbi:hypothetical protein [Sphingomonas jeddahensis]|uniref:DUF5666 domain-containing protein n=1 Tax=Sphingomonas jeddahensis TaxID=1915074 RepID=A0A1V2ERT0_9SPHN|nr:hypothetical protein [Sphingomonas jeddahensis]ONF95207.1 hypothetical protein SPHI_26280 [Sphingomonas jeddahensis]
MRVLMLSALLLATGSVAFAKPLPLSDEELAEVTGKFMLPNGAAIAMSVTSDTLVDGQLVLRSTLTVNDRASLAVFGSDGTPTPPRATARAGATPAGVTILVDRQSGLRSITPTYAAPAVAVNVKDGPAASGATGVVPLALRPGMAVETPHGVVSLAASGNRVTLSGNQIDVTHLMGPAIATAITNAANDRTIDTITSVDLDLTRITPLTLGGARLGASDLALDATTRLVR